MTILSSLEVKILVEHRHPVMLSVMFFRKPEMTENIPVPEFYDVGKFIEHTCPQDMKIVYPILLRLNQLLELHHHSNI